MPHISKHELKPAHQKKLYGQFSAFLGRSKRKHIEHIFSDILGEEEQVMLAKRFAAIVMLAEDNSTYRVAQLLHLSPSTVDRLRTNMRNGTYDHVLHILGQNKKAYQDFWSTLEVVLRAGMPPMGRGRWKSVYNHLRPKY